MSDERDGRGEELSRRELERQVQDLRRDKVRIDDNIRRMEATQKRIFGEQEQASQARITAAQDDEKKDDDKDKDDEKDEKKEDKSDDEDSKKRKREEDAERRKREGRPTAADPRSRNLFGKMLGHLHSAKDRLNKEKTTKSAQQQSAALQKVEEKVNLNKMNIKEFRKGQFATNMVEEKAKLVEISAMIAEKEKLLLQRRLEQHYGLMMNFIRTKAQPTIFFMPAKHTRDSEKQLEETRAAIKNKISSLKVQLQQTEDEVEAEEALRASAAAAAAAAMEDGAGKKENGADKDDKDDKDEKEDDEPEKKKQKTEKEDDSDED